MAETCLWTLISCLIRSVQFCAWRLGPKLCATNCTWCHKFFPALSWSLWLLEGQGFLFGEDERCIVRCESFRAPVQCRFQISEYGHLCVQAQGRASLAHVLTLLVSYLVVQFDTP